MGRSNGNLWCIWYRPRKNRHYQEEGEEEEADEVVPDGIEEVELARIRLEQAQRECRLLSRDLRTLRHHGLSDDYSSFNSSTSEDDSLWMISSPRSILVSWVSEYARIGSQRCPKPQTSEDTLKKVIYTFSVFRRSEYDS